jgi:acetyltransferase-like isoleucine patch superfamily enzyme
VRKLPQNTQIGENVMFGSDVKINVTERLVIGDRTVIGSHVTIEGREVILGRECWLAEWSSIGGGSCFEWQSKFIAGDWLHMGKFAHVNTARSVEIGDEVGLGRLTCVYTHGAYLSPLDGFPADFDGVSIGSRVWIPKATVMPGVKLGNDIVVAAESLVNNTFPDGCLIGGVPARRLRDNAYPREATNWEVAEVIKRIESNAESMLTFFQGDTTRDGHDTLLVGSTMFDLTNRTVEGAADDCTERVKNLLRRNGIRFRYTARDGRYEPW